MRNLLLIIVLCGICACTSLSAQRAVPIVPKPRIIRDLGGTVIFIPSQTSIQLATRDTSALMPAVDDKYTSLAALYALPP